MLPDKGLSHSEVVELAKHYDGYGKFEVADGRVSGAVYTDCSSQHVALLTDVGLFGEELPLQIYRMYAFSNPLHPDVFPGVRKMEAEVCLHLQSYLQAIRMVLTLYHAPDAARGSLTTGGTESIILACFAYRNAARARGIEDPVIVCPITAHAAFDKVLFVFSHAGSGGGSVWNAHSAHSSGREQPGGCEGDASRHQLGHVHARRIGAQFPHRLRGSH